MQRNRFYCLEACRGVASLIVLFRHMCVHAFEGTHPIILIPVPSATAVIFFFVLSGTVMGLTHRDDYPGWASSLMFMLRRVLRIYPLYWIILAVTCWMWPFLIKDNLLLIWIFLAPSSSPANDIVPTAWTLHWEIFFYVVFALYIFLGRRNILLWGWFALLILFNTVIKLPALPTYFDSVAKIVTNPMGMFFLVGIGVSSILQKDILDAKVAKYLIFAGICVTLYSVSLEHYGLFFPSKLVDIMVAAIGMGGIIIALIVLEKSGKTPTPKWFLFLGKVSYPMYVSHWLLMDLTFREFWENNINVTQHYMLYAAALTSVSLAGSIILTYFIDVPIQFMSKRIISGFSVFLQKNHSPLKGGLS